MCHARSFSGTLDFVVLGHDIPRTTGPTDTSSRVGTPGTNIQRGTGDSRPFQEASYIVNIRIICMYMYRNIVGESHYENMDMLLR